MRRARRVYSAHYGAAREVGPWTWRGFSCGASYFCLWRLALFVVVLLVMDLSRLRMQPDFEIEPGGPGGGVIIRMRSAYSLSKGDHFLFLRPRIQKVASGLLA